MSNEFNPVTNILEINYGQTLFVLSSGEIKVYRWWGTQKIQFYWLTGYRVFETEQDAKYASEFVKEFTKSNPKQLNYIVDIPEQGEVLWYGVNMDGYIDDRVPINFDINNKEHKHLLDTFRLYKFPQDVSNASHRITLALETEYKRQKYKYLTEVKPDTQVWYLNFTTPTACNAQFQFDVNFFYYSPSIPSHPVLLARGLLFLKKEHAIQAGNAMLKTINPSADELKFLCEN